MRVRQNDEILTMLRYLLKHNGANFAKIKITHCWRSTKMICFRVTPGNNKKRAILTISISFTKSFDYLEN